VAGVVVADFASNERALRYWLVMVPVFGVLSMVMTGVRAGRNGDELWSALLRQLLHWSALGAAIGLLFYLQDAKRLPERDVPLLSLLALALTTFLAGVHGDWRFAVVGLILGAAATVMALFETYRLLILIPIAIVALVVVLRRRREPAGSAEPYPGASPDPTT